ncbi:ABC transporter ATP-binding protein [Candidatus Obscuribacterales bacterium]|nr:ABC transporter ATP-binding protein [Candidatus Obscuribacterales bacterium]MBX3152366.1 ABC transporter ATP-binding protein [Candidatus Obscuribacterales bacterium]
MSNVIELKDVWRIYNEGAEEPVYALQGVSISIRHGEYSAIVGTSGSGKSTLMNIIGCLDRPTRGTYMLDGIDIENRSDDELATIRNKTVGFVFQQFNLLGSMSALKNVMLPLVYAGIPGKERKIRAELALKEVGLENRMHHRPNELSGGQQQRVAIARAIVNKPSILLADEPTGALDSTTASEIMDLFGRLVKEGMTVILVTHDPETASRANRIIKVRDGKILEDIAMGTVS